MSSDRRERDGRDMAALDLLRRAIAALAHYAPEEPATSVAASIRLYLGETHG